ncbi:homeobox-leucine zipper protein ATHB-4 [Amaranthus tricolor]|uniref:homeobox-leucine zipper protein ATHB-4 n=1 Tax=Amaranthus tricolor TaxID=29722 RepID=UPI0025860C56|nr:homeobox-leucine zipper protein ATHB-4 [Amaranthus tricolor]
MMVPKINKVGIEIKPPLLVDLEITSKVVVSPNSNISSTATGKHLGDFKFNGGEMTSDEDKGGNGGGSCSDHRKKLRLGKAQIMVLEQAFREHTILNTKQKMALAKQVKLRPRQVEVWFQNRRARTKLKQIEVDCEYFRRYCEKLSEENKKLEKEVQKLRALKASTSHQQPTTLSMCPSCISSSTPVAETRSCPVAILYRPLPLNVNK